jgi:hypothetical protein
VRIYSGADLQWCGFTAVRIYSGADLQWCGLAGTPKKEVIGGPFDLTKHLDEDGIKV